MSTELRNDTTTPPFDEFKDPLITDWKRLRSCIEREDELIDQRLRWLLTSQGFLFTAFAVTLAATLSPQSTDEARGFAELLVGALALVALMICVFIWVKIRTAELHLRKLERHWRKRCGSLEVSKLHPPIMGLQSGLLDRWLPFRVLPVLFGVGWMLFAALVLRQELQRFAGPIGQALLVATSASALAFIFFALGRRARSLEKERGDDED